MHEGGGTPEQSQDCGDPVYAYTPEPRSKQAMCGCIGI